MSLKDKILSEDDLIKVLGRTSYLNTKARIAQRVSMDTVLSLDGVRWWAVREERRLQDEIYDTTAALDTINRHHQVWAHISKVDPTRVAYTPDAAFGERDAQLIISFGKLVAKLLPFATDEYVKRLVEDHAAEASNEVEFLVGDAIAEAYNTCTVSSCMTNKSWHGLPEGVDPLKAYSADGIKLAVMRDSQGKITARCLTYEKGDDKRLIRCYGNAALGKRLVRLGYKHSGWYDVEFNTQLWETDRKGVFNVAVPYLDQNGVASRADGSSVMLVDGKLVGVPKAAHLRLQTLFGQSACAVPSTHGYVTVKALTSDQFAVKDDLTGETGNILTQEFVKTVLPDGTVARTLSTGDLVDAFHHTETGDSFTVYVPKSRTFMHAWTRYVESDYARVACGFVKLSAKHYPNQQDSWHSKETLVYAGEENGYMRASDVVRIFDCEAQRKKAIPFNELTKKHIRLADFEGRRYYVKPEHASFVLRTAKTKAKVVKGLHDLKETWRGIDYARGNNNAVSVCGEKVWYSGTENQKPEFKEFVANRRAQALEKAWEEPHWAEKFRYVWSVVSFSNWMVYPESGNVHFTQRTRAIPSGASAGYVREFIRAAEITFRNHGDENINAALSFMKLKLAEMEAVEYPNHVKTAEVVAETAQEVELETA